MGSQFDSDATRHLPEARHAQDMNTRPEGLPLASLLIVNLNRCERAMSKTYLKIKIKSLAEEARIIRREEKRFPGWHGTRTGLYLHRVQVVRREARAALLAYGFLRGRRYERIEAKRRGEEPDWRRVTQLVQKYGPLGSASLIEGWRDGGPGLPKPTAIEKIAA